MTNSTSDHPLVALRRNLFEGGHLGKCLPSSIDGLRQFLAGTKDSQTQFVIWKRLREQGVEPPAEVEDAIFGVVGDVGMSGNCVTVFGMSDGSSSLYTSTGGGVIGAGSKEHVRKASRRLIEVAGQHAKDLPYVTEFPEPAPGNLRFSLLSARGVRAIEAGENEVTTTQHPLFPVFAAWNDLVSGRSRILGAQH